MQTSLINWLGLTLIVSFLTGFDLKAEDQTDLYSISKERIASYAALTPDEFTKMILKQEFELLNEEEDGCKNYWKFCMDCEYDVSFEICPPEDDYFSVNFQSEKKDSADVEPLRKLVLSLKNELKEDELSQQPLDDGTQTVYYFENGSTGFTIYLSEMYMCNFDTDTDCYYAFVAVSHQELEELNEEED